MPVIFQAKAQLLPSKGRNLIGEMAIVYVAENFAPACRDFKKSASFPRLFRSDGSDNTCKGRPRPWAETSPADRMAVRAGISGFEKQARERTNFFWFHVPVEQWSCRRARGRFTRRSSRPFTATERKPEAVGHLEDDEEFCRGFAEG